MSLKFKLSSAHDEIHIKEEDDKDFILNYLKSKNIEIQFDHIEKYQCYRTEKTIITNVYKLIPNQIIKFKNLKELIKFVDILGKCIIEKDEIMIYNDYIE